jgi:quinol monooxygenase YgiN
MARGASLIVLSRYHPLPGQRVELVAAVARVAELATAGAGCYGARAFRSDQDGQTVVLISRWESDDAEATFARSRAFIAERDRCALLLARPVAEERFRPQ